MESVEKYRTWNMLKGMLKEIKTYKDVNEPWVDRAFLKIWQIMEITKSEELYPHLLFIRNLIIHQNLDRKANFVPLKQMISLVSGTPSDLGLPSPAMTGQIRWGNVMAEFHQFLSDFGFDGQHLSDWKIEDVISITVLEIAEGK